MIIQLILFIITFIIGYYLYHYIYNQLYFWKRDIKFSRGVPFFGNVMRSSLGLRHFVEDLDVVYKEFPGEKYIGYVEGTRRVIMIRDLEMAKRVLIKDFQHFTDRKDFIPAHLDPLLGNSVLSLKGDNWREMRAKLTATFTTSKMKCMMPLMAQVAKNIINYIEDHHSEPINATELMRMYSNDVIASAIFGISIDTTKDGNNQFFKIGKDTLTFSPSKMLCLFLTAECPSTVNFMKMLGVQMTKPKNEQFFRDVITDAINHRKKNNIIRADMINILLQATTTEWNREEIIGQAYVSFLAAFETVASVLAMSIHVLMDKPEVQDKLYEEIKAIEEINGLTYDSVVDLKYLDCVINEVHRLWASSVVLDRTCTMKYELPPPKDGAKPYFLNPGDIVYFPINSVQLDPVNFPEPHRFDPDRFSDENKHQVKAMSFLPFGAGPRSCFGMRLAAIELKVMLYNILLNFKIEKCERTPEKITLHPALFSVTCRGGSWVQFTPRK